MAKKIPFTNRLIKEKSPYLLQHAHNPVDWYPWGEEAFKAAKEQDKPIFLSIGYATCHWCHTMEKESFENDTLADLMNHAFVNIKVDREERPDVDGVYMDFAQSMLVGSAGWPLNLILTPDLKPFFAATYLPAFTKHGMMGLSDLIHRILDVWNGEERDKVEMQANRILEAFNQKITESHQDIPPKTIVKVAAENLFKISDPLYGGLKGAPKFPVGYQYNFLLAYSSVMKDNRGLFLVERTLDMMHRGGIFDHLGGGFSRYSTDERWIIPHFEKMLYDNALIAEAYINAWKVTKKDQYKEVSCSILDYILRDMTHPEGGFYSAEDADSEGKEGWFYIWSYEELKKLIKPEDFDLILDYFAFSIEGNFEGKNVLYTPLRKDEFVKNHLLDPHDFEKRLSENLAILYSARKNRVHPFKDDKVLTAWNGLMIHAFAEAGAAFQEKKYLDAAKKAVSFISIYLWNREDLGRRYREGEVLSHGGLDDYAFFIRGLITLFEKTGEMDYLNSALLLTERVESLFLSDLGGYNQSDGSDEHLIVQKRTLSDSAEPSGNAVHTENLLRLYHLTYDEKFLMRAKEIFKLVSQMLQAYPPGFIYHSMNLNRFYDQNAMTVIIAFNDKKEFYGPILNALYSKYLPHQSIVVIESKTEKFKKITPVWNEYKPIDNKTTLYLCRNGSCLEPVSDFQKIIDSIERL